MAQRLQENLVNTVTHSFDYWKQRYFAIFCYSAWQADIMPFFFVKKTQTKQQETSIW